jgi:hypothetical protein
MFDKIIVQRKMLKQKKCLIALLRILKDENVLVYRTAQGLIKRHESYRCHKYKMNTLEGIRLFYMDDLKEHEEMLKYKCLELSKKIQYKSFVEADKLFLNEFNDEFIDTYNRIVLDINVVAKLHKYLGVEHQQLLLLFYDLVKDTQYENELLDSNTKNNGIKKI